MDFVSLKELQSKYLAGSHSRLNICPISGKDNSVYDSLGRAYLDLTGGYGENILGYGHPSLVSAVTQQIEKLLCVGDGLYNEISAHLAHELIEGSVFDRVIFDGTGISSLAGAFKLVKNYYDSKNLKKSILIVSDTLSGISLGSVYESHFPGQSQMLKFTPQNDFEKLKKNLTDDVGAVMLETLQPENGLTLTKLDFLLNTYALCKSKGSLLIMNEFVGGVGRTGSMFSFDYSGIQPDIVLISKGLGGGMPLSAILTKNEIAYSMPKDRNFLSSSFLPSLAAASVVIKELKSGLTERVTNIGNYFKAKLFKLSKFEFVKEIRGIGLIIGLELDSKIDAYEMVIRMSREGILASINVKNTIIFMPPYTITAQEIDYAVDIISKIFSEQK